MEIFFNTIGTFLSLELGMGYMVLLFVLSIGLILLGLVVGQKGRYEWAKLSAFECGFDSLTSARSPFSLRFFLLSLLFLVFDVEIVLIFPYIFSVMISSAKMWLVSKFMGFVFLIILVLGLIHELNEGTLDWKLD